MFGERVERGSVPCVCRALTGLLLQSHVLVPVGVSLRSPPLLNTTKLQGLGGGGGGEWACFVFQTHLKNRDNSLATKPKNDSCAFLANCAISYIRVNSERNISM